MKRTWHVLFGVLVLAVPAAHAQFDLATNDGKITITEYTGAGGDVAIPSTTNGLPVTSIGANAFDGALVTSVSISDNVTTIGSGAFLYCSDLASVTIPNSVTTIGNYAFEYTPLLSVAIPSSVTNIGSSAFSGCSELAAINVETNDPDYISITGVLFNRSLTTLIQYPQGKLATTYTIPNSVAIIGESAFSGCYLTNITIGSGVTAIGAAAFSGSSLAAINVQTNNPVYSSVAGVLFNQNQTTLIEYPTHKNATSYVIPRGVTTIGAASFSASSLTNVTIPEGVATIGIDAFSSARLTTITIPETVTTIGAGAFMYCNDLPAINVETNNPFYSSIGGVLFNRSHTAVLEFPGGKTATSYSIPSGVTTIGVSAFQGLTLTNITIPSSVTTIEAYAFQFCENLTSVTIPNNVTSIGSGAFQLCDDLTSAFFIGDSPSGDSTVFVDDNNATIYYLPKTPGWGATFGGAPTALWNPSFQVGGADFGVRGNHFGFNITGTTNIPIVVEASTDLANPVWTPLTNATLANGSFFFNDLQWANYPDRFYRIRSP